MKIVILTLINNSLIFHSQKKEISFNYMTSKNILQYFNPFHTSYSHCFSFCLIEFWSWYFLNPFKKFKKFYKWFCFFKKSVVSSTYAVWENYKQNYKFKSYKYLKVCRPFVFLFDLINANAPSQTKMKSKHIYTISRISFSCCFF